MPLNCKISFILLFLALTAYGQMQERLAIIQTLDNNDSIGFNDLSYLTDKLRETAVNVLPKEQYGVMTTESIIAFLGSQEKARKACNESSCLAELGRKVSADYVAQGRIGRFGRDLTIKVELYSVKSGNLIGSFTGDSKDIYGLRDIITEKATDLFKKMPNTSNVKKTVPPPEAPTPPPPPTLVTPPEAPTQPLAPVASPIPQDIPPEEPETYIDNLENIYSLFEMDFEEHENALKKLSLSLSYYDKGSLYDRYRKKYALACALLNVLPSLGVGSFVQGNTIWGLTQLVLEIGSLVVVNIDHRSSYQKSGAVMIGSGFAIGLIAPFVYQYTYNKRLKDALNFDENFSLSIDPLIVPRDGTPAVGLAFNVRY